MLKVLSAVLLLLFASTAHAKLITAEWESPLNVQSDGVFSGVFTGFDYNNDDYLTYDELYTFDLVFSGDETTPMFSHDIGNLLPDDNNPANNFLFTLRQHCDTSGLNCDFPIGPTGTGLPDMLSVATADSFLLGPTGFYRGSGNFSVFSYGNDAWTFGQPGNSSFRGFGFMNVTIPNPASSLLVALGFAILLRRRKSA